jgi:uncharacterized protein (DUF302 family)
MRNCPSDPTRRYILVGGLAAIVAGVATIGSFALIESFRSGKERTMNAGDLVDADLVTLPSAHGATETVERLKSLLSHKGNQVFADIDHAAAAHEVGLSLRPTRVLIFGNPRAGTPLMQSRQTIGLDLPLRALVWEDEAGKVWLTYHRLESLARRHHVVGRDDAVKALGAGLDALARAATSV